MPIKSYAESTFYLEPDLERAYERYVRGGGTREAMAVALLGDSSYTQKFHMPKWNRTVDMLEDPQVAVRHMNELGIPGSKSAHRERATHFHDLKKLLDDTWQELVDLCVELTGKEGPLVSGIYRSHFPPPAKDRLRFLSHGTTMASDAERLHLALTKTRSPLFSW